MTLKSWRHWYVTLVKTYMKDEGVCFVHELEVYIIKTKTSWQCQTSFHITGQRIRGGSNLTQGIIEDCLSLLLCMSANNIFYHHVTIVSITRKMQKKRKSNAPAANRTRGPSMATMDFTTKPLALMIDIGFDASTKLMRGNLQRFVLVT